jgi:L-malate glycosyltransferase
MKVAIICPDYPSKIKSSFAFVHARAKLYLKLNLEVMVFIISKMEESSYIFEDVVITKEPKQKLLESIKSFSPDLIAIHFAHYQIISLVKKLDYPKISWIHGHEIMWSFKIQSPKNIFDFIKKWIVLLPRELYQILKIRNHLDNVQFSVFVSNWMLKIAQKHSFKKYHNSAIIPNPVDTELFKLNSTININKAISLRSFENKKYGLDLAIKAFSNFKKAELHLYGRGRYKNKFMRLCQKINSNTHIHDIHIPHNKLGDLYKNYGFFIAPSRVEAQGLAMCEAMSVGLPIIGTNVGGIPEFVRDGIDGYLVPPENPTALRSAIEKLISDKQKFVQFSLNAHNRIKEICSAHIVIEKEIELMKKAINKFRDIN